MKNKFKKVFDNFKQLRETKKELMDDATILYNECLCPKCKRLAVVKIKSGKTAAMKDYCDSCQKSIIKRFGDKYS